MTRRVAQVGALKRWTSGDSGRWMVAFDWLLRNAPDTATSVGPWEHDAVNLNYKRDFLAESATYDIVVLHDIYDPKANGRLANVAVRGLERSIRAATQVSPLHDERLEAWRTRLVGTGARFIFVFETAPSCVNGWNLGDLPGYHQRHIDRHFAVYERNAP